MTERRQHIANVNMSSCSLKIAGRNDMQRSTLNTTCFPSDVTRVRYLCLNCHLLGGPRLARLWYSQVWDQWLKEGRWAPCLVYTPLKNMVTFTCYLYWGDSCNEKKLNTCFSASISMNCWTLVSTGITARSLDACISASIAASLPASMCLTPAPRPFPPRLHNNKNQ